MKHYKRQRAGKPLVDSTPPVGSPSGHGRYGILEDDGTRVMCHECGAWVRSVGSHAKPAHGMTAAEYRERHGLPRGQSLNASSLREHRSAKSRERIGSQAWRRFEEARDPAAASAARDAGAMASTARHRPQDQPVVNGCAARRVRVVTCAVCLSSWCPLPGGYRRQVCSDECVRVLLAWINRSGAENAARDAQIVAQVVGLGRDYGAVGKEHGLGRERVGQIVRKHLGAGAPVSRT